MCVLMEVLYIRYDQARSFTVYCLNFADALKYSMINEYL